MAKDNLFLGTARGSVGDVTFSRLNGVQVARVRNRAPRNPQTPAQMVQRICMSSVGKAYSFMQEICNHSFEGFETGQLSQRKFMEVNVGIMRDKCADVLAYPVEEVVRSSEVYNFSYKNDYAPVLNQYQISAGSLPSIALVNLEDGFPSTVSFDPGDLTTQTITYQDVCTLLGLQRGDQLTFIQATHDGSKSGHDTDILTGFRYARVILEPASGDMSTTFLSGNAINNPNERNEGSFSTLTVSNTETSKGLYFVINGVALPADTTHPDRQLAASAVILSRQVGGIWKRSTQFLLPRWTGGAQLLKSSTLGLAYDSYNIGAASDLYLNQAE